MQFYTGQHLKYHSKNKIIKKYQGLCLETQFYPNSPNNKKFPSTLITPNNTYNHNMRFVINEFWIILIFLLFLNYDYQKIIEELYKQTDLKEKVSLFEIVTHQK